MDPGFSGALALYDIGSACLAGLWDMPVATQKKGKTGKKSLDLPLLCDIIALHQKEILIAAIEKVHSLPNDGHVGAFNFGVQFGALKGILASNLVRTVAIEPGVWKSALGLSSNKKDSLNRARAQFTSHLHYFKRQKDEGRAEAALIAFFAYTQLFLK